MRVALHCGIAMDDLSFNWGPDLTDLTNLWTKLKQLDAFKDKEFPEKTRPEVWRAAMRDNFTSPDEVVVLTASLTLNTSKTGPLFTLRLRPLKLDLPHRLDRRFGSDRFIELIMPASHSKEIKDFVRRDKSAWDSIHCWLVRDSHVFLGRVWTSFFTKSAETEKVKRDDTLRPDVVTLMRERIYMFAENGNDFDLTTAQSFPPKSELSAKHTKMTRQGLLDWLLQIPQNQGQSVYKLFSRIALGLSRTQPTVVLEPGQIRHRENDLVSPTGKVMNDGIARMSTALARRVRDMIGLEDIPAGFQGRFGSAKGMWIRDTEDTSDEIWIETYPSQRKWKCDYGEEDFRTFEVGGEARELKAASLNLQLLPILEDRAINRTRMKEQVGIFLKNSLLREMESQKVAMQDPALFNMWAYEETAQSRRQNRVKVGHVPFLGGLPLNRGDQMELLLSSGFDPTKLKFLQEMAMDIQRDKCKDLQTKLNVRLGCSTYAYMVIDFLGILAEDEIHLGFSSKFTDEQSGFSETYLHGIDVLVARVPAHYPSDIQKVKAVFKPELGSLKDVVIFPSKGSTPLADKLSGGDYDGDKAWICWEPTIVNNFTNADAPETPDLFRNVLIQTKDTYQDLANSCSRKVNSPPKDTTTEFLDQAFRFNMEQNLLGTCTNYKEKLCYSRNSISDDPAIFLSTLISHLVDRAKQGIVLENQSWDKVRIDLNGLQRDPDRSKRRLDPPQPQYKLDNWAVDGEPSHIVDYVKFVVGKPTVEQELKKLNQRFGTAFDYDADLTKFCAYFQKFQRPFEQIRQERVKPKLWELIFEKLKSDIDAVAQAWTKSIQSEKTSREANITNVHDMWKEIKPCEKALKSKTIDAMCEHGLAAVGLSQWDLLKASYTFRLYYDRSSKFPWFVAGYQLCYLKSVYASGGKDIHAPPMLMTPRMYAGVKPDARYVKNRATIMDGKRMEAVGEEEEDLELEDGSLDDDV
ncbi:RNA dependent RNA polymerase-domain-containing protein [Xylariaceae sp. FL1019]|nr:RNA dependent RNA polymerase-domain-containing protein [Xylariaceae sp. FL1019]